MGISCFKAISGWDGWNGWISVRGYSMLMVFLLNWVSCSTGFLAQLGFLLNWVSCSTGFLAQLGFLLNWVSWSSVILVKRDFGQLVENQQSYEQLNSWSNGFMANSVMSITMMTKRSLGQLGVWSTPFSPI